MIGRTSVIALLTGEMVLRLRRMLVPNAFQVVLLHSALLLARLMRLDNSQSESIVPVDACMLRLTLFGSR